MSKQITVAGVTVEVPTPFAEGHTCTAAEAATLNQTLAENVANNKRKAIKEAKEAGDEKALAAAIADLQKYAGEYQFSLASARGSRSTKTPLEKMCEKLAKEALLGELKKAGITLKAYKEKNGDEYVASKVLEIAGLESIQKLAKEELKRAEKRAEAVDVSI